MDDVTLRIGGSTGQIAARALHSALGALLDMLEEADRETSEMTHPWVLTSLQEGSAVAGFGHPAPGQVLVLVERGLSDLRRDGLIPTGWTSEMVRKVRGLGRLVGRTGAESVEVTLRGRDQAWRIDGQLTTHADQALQPAETTFGAVSGKVDRWSERREHLVGITLDGGQTLSARFSPELRHRILDEAVGNRGEFWGDLDRNASGQPVALRIVDFEVREEPSLPIPPSQARGILRGEEWTLEEWMEARDV